jgi:hypothetical protein
MYEYCNMPTIQLQFRRGTAAEWSNANTILAAGELGLETSTSQFKIGNGTTAWNSLAYGGLRGDQGNTGSVGALLSGTVSAPSLAFLSDISSGFYLPSASNVGFATSGVERMRFGSNVVFQAPMRARIITSNISGTSATVEFVSNDGIYYTLGNTGFNALTLTFPGNGIAPGSFNVFRNTTGANMSVSLTYSGGGSGISSPLAISSSNTVTVVWNGSSYVLF